MGKLEFFKKVHGLIKSADESSLSLSMDNVHHKGLFSLVIGGSEHGKLTRVFIAGNRLRPFKVQLHTHRYPIKLTSIKGSIVQHVADPSTNETELSVFEYRSPLNGGDGLKYLYERQFGLRDYILPIGATVRMGVDEFHTISCSKGSIWIVEEGGFEVDCSKVLGVPFVLDGLYSRPRQFQVNDNCQLVGREIKKLILDYELT